MEAMTVIVCRLAVAFIFAVGAVWLAGEGRDGWGWCIFASIVLGSVTFSHRAIDAPAKKGE